MSTPKEAHDALANLAVALARRRVPSTEANEIQQGLLKKYSCNKPVDLQNLDAAQCASLIDEAAVLAGEPLPLAPLYERLVVCVNALTDGECPRGYKGEVLRTMATTPDLEPTQEDEILNLLKPKLTGKVKIGSLRKEFEAVQRKVRAPKNAVPKHAEFVLFRDHASDTYYGGVYDPVTDEWIENRPLRAIRPTSIAQFCGQSGRPTVAPEQIDFGSFDFRPGAKPQLVKTPLGYQINHWTCPEVRKRAVPSIVVPPAIRKVLLHALGGDERVLKHFVNWLAVAFQTHGRVNTSWLLGGRTGTGKGMLFDVIITGLWGDKYCFSMMAKNLEDQFNGWAEHCQMLNINEAEVLGSHTEGKLRIYTTDPYIPVRGIQKALVKARNYLNIIYTSNSNNPLKIAVTDRRINVSPRQEQPLENDDPVRLAVLAAQLVAELPQFAGYLASYPADVALASKPMQTEQRDIIIETSTPTPDRILQAIKTGDLDYFIETYFENADGADEWVSGYTLLHNARAVLLEWTRAAASAGEPVDIRASQVAKMHNFFLQDRKYESSPVDMGRRMKKAGCRPGKRSDNSRSQPYAVQWRTKETTEGLAQIIEALEHPKKADPQSASKAA